MSASDEDDVRKADAARWRSSLLAWYRCKRRDLPWRRSLDPYRILVSEIMLQQTQVEAVVRPFERFVGRFGSIEDLAAAREEEVLALWSGLGYYTRARRLHAAARRIVELGGFPSTSSGLAELPGVGEYTAAAVASMAFGERTPVLDGNVERVLSRVLALDGDPKRVSARRRLLLVASKLIDDCQPGESNQALMEVGALLCRPAQAVCNECPLREPCRARKTEDPLRFPRPRKRRETVKVRLLMPFVWRDGKLLLLRGAEDAAWLRGVWHPPLIPVGAGGSWPVPRGRARTLTRETLGLDLALVRGPLELRHAITFRRFEISGYAARLVGEAGGAGERQRWFSPREIEQVATSSLVAKGLRAGLES